MSQYDFTKQFAEFVEPLDLFFHKKLRGSKIKYGIEDKKNELIQNTALEVLLKLNNEKYNDYSFDALIWIKANDVWLNYISSQKKESFIHVQSEELKELSISNDSFKQFEQANLIQFLKSKVDKFSWKIIVMRADGFQYKDIAKHFHKTEGSVKMQIFRLKSKIVLNRL
jgi:DNA-directed RNA polymerase specialized sigma24 family protein